MSGFDAGKPNRAPISHSVKLFDNSAERYKVEELTTLYTIIRMTESLEKAYSRDAVTANEYSEECNKLISQFKSTERALVNQGWIKDASDFIEQFSIQCPRAKDRLIRYGVPSTVLHASHDDHDAAYASAEATAAFVSLMDSIRLEQRAVDEIKPLVIQLLTCLGKVPLIPSNFEGTVKMTLWLEKLHKMEAVDEISENDARQLLMELESSYVAYLECLKQK